MICRIDLDKLDNDLGKLFLEDLVEKLFWTEYVAPDVDFFMWG